MNPDKINVDDYFEIIEVESDAGNTKVGSVDKNGHCYHTTQQTRNKMALFNSDIANYRHCILCKLCIRYHVLILFTVVMPNHTHDVLWGKNWETISTVLRLVNTYVVRYVNKNYPKRKGLPMFNGRPSYKVVKSMDHLFFLGKYTQWNAETKETPDSPGPPFSCFWMFPKSTFTSPYNPAIYMELFGFSAPQLYEFYKSHTKKEVYNYARKHFGAYSDAIFKVDPTKSWRSDELS